MNALLVILFILLIVRGCTRPAEQPLETILPTEGGTGIPVDTVPIDIMARWVDATKVLVTQNWAPDTDKPIERETTVITNIRNVYIESTGSRFDTTPVRIGGTDLLQAPSIETGLVRITGSCTNGSFMDILDTKSDLSPVPNPTPSDDNGMRNPVRR